MKTIELLILYFLTFMAGAIAMNAIIVFSTARSDPGYRPVGWFEHLPYPLKTPERYEACLSCMDYAVTHDCNICAYGRIK